MEKNEPKIVGARPVSPADAVSFPTSVQERLDEARSLLAQDRPGEAIAAIEQAGAELARSNPEALLLAIGTQMGAKHVVADETVEDVSTVQNGSYFLGIKWKHDQVTTTDRKKTKKTIGLS